jgi:hypothetical protein
VAGILDGEGCIWIPKPASRYHSPQAIVTNSDLDLLNWIQERFGGRIQQKNRSAADGVKRTGACYDLKWGGGRSVAKLLTSLLPYLIVKRAKAEAAVAQAAQVRLNQRFGRPRLRVDDSAHEIITLPPIGHPALL